MLQKVILITLPMFFVAGCDRSLDQLPELRPCDGPPTGFTMTFVNGRDFYVWEIEDEDRSIQNHVAVIYVGLDAILQLPAESSSEPGRLADQDTMWNQWVSEQTELSEALVEYKHDRQSMKVEIHALVVTPLENDDRLKNWVSTVSLCLNSEGVNSVR